MEAAPQYRNHALDGLRGIAATSVIFYHAILSHHALMQTVLEPPLQHLSTANDIAVKIALSIFHGHTAVLLFFVLSGFVLTKSLERSSGPTFIIIANFAIRRVMRLYPAMMFCMGCLYLIALMYAAFGWRHFPPPDIEAVALNASLIKITYHGPSLTIQGEMLAMPFLLLAFFLTRKWGPPATLGFLALSMFAMQSPALVLWAPNMNSWLPAFLFGAVVSDNRLAPYFSGVTGPALLMLAVAVVLLRMFVPGSAVSGAIAQMLLCAALVGCVYHADGRHALIQFLECQPVQFMGRISYSLYLLNVIWLLIFASIIGPDWHARYPLSLGLLLGLLVTLLTIPFAMFSERVIEQGGIRLGRKLSLSTKITAVPEALPANKL